MISTGISRNGERNRLTTALGFRGDIQGLRAIAVLSVVIFHASAGAWLTGGFVGVDIFFVISGFLITCILLKDNEQDRFSLIAFYQRRIRRLFPALLTVLLFTLATGAMLLPSAAYSELAATTVATLLFVSNFAFLKLSGYFEGAVEYKPLLHTWSLAVEEQFYILFPIVLFLLWRFARRVIGPVLLVSALLSLALSVWMMSAAHPNAAFYLAAPRAFELLIGALVAYHPNIMGRLGQTFRDGLSLLGLILIIVSIFSINDTLAFPGAIALVPCLGTAFVISAGQINSSLGGRMISSAPFVLFGNISYSLYLWHWPLLSLGRNWALGPLHPVIAAGIALLSTIIAYASWRWIEQPFIRGWPRLRVITTGLTMVAVLTAFCATLFILDGLPQRFSHTSQTFFAAEEDYNRSRPYCHSGEGEPIIYDRNCIFGAPGAPPSVAVWADSHGAELVVALGERMAEEQSAVMQITASGCPPALNFTVRQRPNCVRHNIETISHLSADTRISQVVMLADFEGYSKTQRAQLEQGFEAAVRALTQAGKHVTIFEPIPTFAYDAPSALGLIVSRGGNPFGWGIPLTDYQEKNAHFLSLIDHIAKDAGAQAISTSALLCPRGFCAAFSEGDGVLYFNADHLSVTGARRLAMAVTLPAKPSEDLQLRAMVRSQPPAQASAHSD